MWRAPVFMSGGTRPTLSDPVSSDLAGPRIRVAYDIFAEVFTPDPGAGNGARPARLSAFSSLFLDGGIFTFLLPRE